MTFTVAKPGGHSTGMGIVGDFRVSVRVLNITSYTTGGEVVGASDMGLASIFALWAIPQEGGTAGNRRMPVWDRTNGKLLIVGDKGTAAAGGNFEEAASTTDVGEFLVFALGY